jgi:hypothetical protein
LASIQHFKSFPDITRYLNTSSVRPIASREFINEYKTIAKLMDNKKLIESCNNFFKDLKIPTRLNTNNAETGWLLFSNPNHKSKKTIPLEEISPGEKTAFILWLLIQTEQKLDILILDDFGAHLSSFEGINYKDNEIPITKMMYIILIKNFINKGVQVL